jgi:hypothetical protein
MDKGVEALPSHELKPQYPEKVKFVTTLQF